LQAGAVLGASWLAAENFLFANSPNERINVGIIGCGIRGREHLTAFHKLPGARISAVCDPDRKRLEEATAQLSGARQYTDMRDIFQMSEIDAVVIATCNHWHALAAIWALEAGKHVYVEKPLSLTHWEGRQLVEAAKKSNRIVQVGTQQRSDPMQQEIKNFLHEEAALGKVEWVLVNRYGPRGPIGLRESALKPPSSVDYSMWLGPAEDVPIYRNSLHYDWHWVWNTGSGEMGNWGVHVLDDVRNVVFQDRATIPKKIVAAGDRVAWGDAGDTPNLQFIVIGTGEVPVVMSLCNLTDEQIDKSVLGTHGPATGYVTFCQNGRLEGQRGQAIAFDKQGKVIREFKGNTGEGSHRRNFLDAIRNNTALEIAAPVEQGHYSTAWCNLANIASQLSHTQDVSTLSELDETFHLPAADQVFKHMEGIVRRYGKGDESFTLGPILTCDEVSECFTGNHASYANSKLNRVTRPEFRVPDYLAKS
jgi:predicted dehydrogenase